MPGTAAHSNYRLRTAHVVGALLTAAGLGILIGLATIMYRGSPHDEALLVGLGIPVLMLIGWAGLVLLLRGLTWVLQRRR